MAPPVLPHAVARRLGPGLGPLQRVGVGGPLLLLLLLPLYTFSNRVDVDASPPRQLLHFHLAAVLVAMRLAEQTAALLAPEAPDSRPHDERRHLGEALEGDAAALAALLLAELLEFVIGHERQHVGLGRVARDRLGLASICGIRTASRARRGASSGTRRLRRWARRLLGARAGNLLRHWGGCMLR